MKIVSAKNAALQSGGVVYSVYSHESLTHPGQYLVHLLGGGMELTTLADSRGAGMIELAEVLRQLGHDLTKMAFEQEGSVKL